MFTVEIRELRLEIYGDTVQIFAETTTSKVKLEWQKRILNQKETWNLMQSKTSQSKYKQMWKMEMERIS